MFPLIVANLWRRQRIEQQQQALEQQNILQERRAAEKTLKRQLRDFGNPFIITEQEFMKNYRLPQYLTLQLIELLYNDLVQTRDNAIPPHEQVLIALAFFAQGSYQLSVSKDFRHPSSQATVSRMITRVTNAIVKISPRFIAFPNSRCRRQSIERKFERQVGFPGVLCLLDCTLIRLFRPSNNEEAFYNHRPSAHCISCEMTCDADYIVTSLKLLPGANNDQFIWQNSDARRHMEALRSNEEILQREGKYYILGDSGYNISPILLTPIIDAIPDSPEEKYTYAHTTTRCKIEQAFGQIKNVWRCLHKERVLHYKPEKASTIIIACTTLHNFRKLNGVPFNEEGHNLEYHDNHHMFSHENGIEERNMIIRRYFTL